MICLGIDKLGENLPVHRYIRGAEVGAVGTAKIIPAQAAQVALAAGWLQL